MKFAPADAPPKFTMNCAAVPVRVERRGRGNGPARRGKGAMRGGKGPARRGQGAAPGGQGAVRWGKGAMRRGKPSAQWGEGTVLRVLTALAHPAEDSTQRRRARRGGAEKNVMKHEDMKHEEQPVSSRVQSSALLHVPCLHVLIFRALTFCLLPSSFCLDFRGGFHIREQNAPARHGVAQ